MAEAIKFTEEELHTLQNLQSTYNQITLAMGQISLSKIQLEEQSVLNTLAEVREQENTLAKELTDKYGKGSLNIETGEFTPIVEEAAEEASQE